MSLEERLKRLLDDAFGTPPEDTVWLVEPVIERIIQAFKDEGYRKWPAKEDAGLPKNFFLDLMTGQEFYDRFEKEVTPGNEIRGMNCREGALIAARKAAGL